MSDPRFIRRGFNFALSHAMGECGEVVAIAVKAQQFGPHSIDPTLGPEDDRYGETNLQGALRELADVDAATTRLCQAITEDTTLLASLPLAQRRWVVARAQSILGEWPA